MIVPVKSSVGCLMPTGPLHVLPGVDDFDVHVLTLGLNTDVLSQVRDELEAAAVTRDGEAVRAVQNHALHTAQ
jgi:hypothetical protein